MKAKQIGFQLLQRLYKPRYLDVTSPTSISTEISWRQLGDQNSGITDELGLSFNYLNQEVSFNEEIAWNYAANGKLWTYNLNYFEYLSNPEIRDDLKLSTMRDFYAKRFTLIEGMEPYPISLRNINWIKFCFASGKREFDSFIYSQATLLSKSFEYHLMGNHLLENAFSLLFAAYYFKDMTFYSLASSVLLEQLDEQILSDGAHFERSPMYHQIILGRLLDSIHLLRHSNWKTDLSVKFDQIASSMLSWVNQVSYSDGSTPMVNDCALDMAPTTHTLIEYANILEVHPLSLPLGECGYRMVRKEAYECFIDIGDIGPDYIPGHAHSDTFSFELYRDGEPLIVDTGISTYEKNKIRHFERSTSAHNTVMIANLDQSEVWASFRVARRASISDLEEESDYYRSIHDGYEERIGVKHQREFLFKTRQIIIRDSIIGHINTSAKALFHFSAKLEPILSGNKCIINAATLSFSDGIGRLIPYEQAEGFNKRIKSRALEIEFSDKLEVRIIV
jgi:hypothetical protein